MFVMLDAVLGIVHQGHSRSFQDDAYKAMLTTRRFVRFRKRVHHETGNVTDFMQRKIRGSAYDAYRTCLESYESFRKYHLGIATRFEFHDEKLKLHVLILVAVQNEHGAYAIRWI